MGTTVKALVVAARAKLAAVVVSRSVSDLFLEHKTSQPFEKSPISKRDGFEIVAQDIVLLSGFGVTGQKEGQFTMTVKLGHAPFGTDDERENYRMLDITRISDIFEAYAWPDGIQACWYEREEVNKDQANWWVTKLFFRFVYTGDIES